MHFKVQFLFLYKPVRMNTLLQFGRMTSKLQRSTLNVSNFFRISLNYQYSIETKTMRYPRSSPDGTVYCLPDAKPATLQLVELEPKSEEV